MKILHCCLAAFYIDNFGYQENILPKIHAAQGHDVSIVASTETYLPSMQLGYVEPATYTSSDGIQVSRLPYQSWLPHNIMRKLRLYSGLKKILEEARPDVVFLHDCQFLSIQEIVSYARSHKVTIFVDCHTDLINSARGWVSKNILHGIVYRFCVKRIEPYTEWFYGTLPVRNDFLHKMYGVSKNKIKLLPFGVDDSLFNSDDKPAIRTATRAKLNIDGDDFVIVTGGKIDKRKQIHILLKAFLRVVDGRQKLKILVFGKPTPELQAIMESFSRHASIVMQSWVEAKEIHKYFICADLAFFPGTHSVLWEEAVGLGLPCVFKRWDGMEHLDLGGNCLLMNETDEDSLTRTIKKIFDDPSLFESLKKAANTKGPATFCYSQIAVKALERRNN